MKENKMPGIIENSAVAWVLPLRPTLSPPQILTETATGRSEFLDDDVKSLDGEVYAG